MKTTALGQKSRFFCAGLMLLAGLGIAGCGGGNGTVSGEVTIDGEKVPFGEVYVLSTKEQQNKMGKISNGSYKVEDVPQGDAVVYVVITPPVNPAGTGMRMPKEKGGDPRMLEEAKKTEAEYKEKMEQYNKIGKKVPVGYAEPKNKWLPIKVTGGTNDFPIKMESGKK